MGRMTAIKDQSRDDRQLCMTTTDDERRDATAVSKRGGGERSLHRIRIRLLPHWKICSPAAADRIMLELLLIMDASDSFSTVGRLPPPLLVFPPSPSPEVIHLAFGLSEHWQERDCVATITSGATSFNTLGFLYRWLTSSHVRNHSPGGKSTLTCEWQFMEMGAIRESLTGMIFYGMGC